MFVTRQGTILDTTFSIIPQYVDTSQQMQKHIDTTMGNACRINMDRMRVAWGNNGGRMEKAWGDNEGVMNIAILKHLFLLYNQTNKHRKST